MTFKEIKLFVLLYIRTNVKTILFNFYYFKFKDAILLPVKVNKNCVFHALKGKVTLPVNISSSMITIGYGYVGIFDNKRQRTLWENYGRIIFNGSAHIGPGSSLCIGEYGELKLGHNFTITAESTIVCHKKITTKEDVLLSWDVLIMDTDFHKIKDINGIITNDDQEITIGNKCWIGCRSTILKGSRLGSNTIIASNTVVTRKFEERNVIIAKNPAEIVKRNVTWEK